MMKKIVECIPNFSEGRDQSKIDQILKAITDVPGAILLDHESDPDHNRSVVTFAGSPESVVEAAFQAMKKAAELIDLNNHTGEHPRMGATDVCPLVPLHGIKSAECIEYAKTLAKRVSDELNIPIYLYEQAATKPERQNLADIRRGQYEGIKAEISNNPDRKPDFGPSELGSAGITAIGVREPLVAYNVNLRTNDLKIATKIANTVRQKEGGFHFCKAMGFTLEEKGIVQVSMNLTNYKKTTVHHVFEAIKREAQRYGVQILESEVIGLIPQAALIKAAQYYLQIDGFKNKQILEQILQKKMDKSRQYLDAFLEATASSSPVPGGGSVAALAGSLAAALSSMVANLTLASSKYEAAHQQMKELVISTETARNRLYQLINEDAAAYRSVGTAYKSKDPIAIQAALKGAASTPLEIAETALSLLPALESLITHGNPNAISDCGVAIHMIEAAVKGGILNIKINVKEIDDATFASEMNEKCNNLRSKLDSKATELTQQIEKALS